MDALDGLLDAKVKNILDLFLKHPEKLYHLNKISDDSDVPLASTFRIVHRLSKSGFLKITKISKLKLYSLDDNRKTRKLRRLL